MTGIGIVGAMTPSGWYWCFTHQRVEADGERDDPDNALGPYPTPQQARDWRTLRDAHDEAWQEADDAWSDDPEGPCE